MATRMRSAATKAKATRREREREALRHWETGPRQLELFPEFERAPKVRSLSEFRQSLSGFIVRT